MPRYGVLLTNIGTPNSTDPKDVGAYLDQFLMDPRVIRVPWIFRALLVKGIIVPFRAARSAALYQKVWTREGSPLMVHSKRFAERLQAALGDEWAVRIGMRYGQPSFESALRSMNAGALDKLVIFPLYPQYALSSTQSSLDHAVDAVKAALDVKEFPAKPKISSVLPFYLHPGYIDSWREIFAETVLGDYDHVVMSFHGLPKAHMTVLARQCEKCPKTEPCPTSTDAVKEQGNCYRRQSYRTAEAIAKAIGIPAGKYTVSFQSRLGYNEWILPNTVQVVDDLRKKNVEKLVVLCPSFVADCLETLEEVQISLKERFLKAGGKEFTALSCLNTHRRWVEAAQEIVCKSVL